MAENSLTRPLCVDLDGTLVSTDTFLESFLQLLRQSPQTFFLFPLWLLRGKAYVKDQVARRMIRDASRWPYRPEVLDYLREERKSGRKIILATAANGQVAAGVAAHLNLFDDVVASDKTHNLGGRRKAAELEKRYGSKGFDYLGSDCSDLPVWKSAAGAVAVACAPAMAARIRRVTQLDKVLSPARPGWLGFLRLFRPHQWVKNVLMIVPVVFAHELHNIPAVVRTVAGMAIFSLLASCVYIFNDLCDLAADRQHPEKRRRALASGDVSLTAALVIFPLLFAIVMAAAVALSKPFALALAFYFLANLLYSSYLKQVVLADVFFLAAFYGWRIYCGSVVTGIPTSSWLFAFSTFLFLSLAIAKRAIELQQWLSGSSLASQRRGYTLEDRQALCSMGVSAGYLSTLVLAFYISSAKVVQLYAHPQILWGVCFLLLYWISYFWLCAFRGRVSRDPVFFALTDPTSLSIAALITGMMFFAS